MPTYLERIREKKRREAQQAVLGLAPGQEEAEQDLLDDLYGGALTGVSYAADTADTPGNWIREMLVGNNPFGHTFDPGKRVTGKDLWRHWTGEDSGFWGGMAVEIATDPLTYLTGGLGAIGKAGKIAKGAGLISKSDDLVRIAAKKALKFKNADDLGDLAKVATTALDKKHSKQWVKLGEELSGGGVGIGPRRARDMLSPRDLITYADDPGIAGGAFDRSMEALAIKKKMGKNWRPSWFEGQMDRKLGAHLRMEAPLTGGMGFNVPGWVPTGQGVLDKMGQSELVGKFGRPLARLLSADVRGAKTKEFQESAKALTRKQEMSRLKARQFVAEQATTAGKLSKQAADPDAMRRFLETGADPGALFSAGDRDTLGLLKKKFGESFEESLIRAQNVGIPIQRLVDPTNVDYFPRFGVGGTPLASRPGMLFSTSDPSSLARASHLKGVVGGTDQIRTIITDKDVNTLVERIRNLKNFPHLKAGTEATEIKRLTKDLDGLLTRKYGSKLLNPDLNSKKAMDILSSGGMPATKTGHVEAMRNWMLGLEPEARRMGVFANHPFADAAIRLTRAEDSIASAELIMAKLAQHGEHASLAGMQMPGGVSVRKTLRDMGLVDNVGDEVPVHLQKLFGEFSSAGKGVGGDVSTMVDDFFIPREVYEELTRVNDFYKVPGAMGDLKKGFDAFLTLTKAHLTTPFAAFAGRNFMSGQFRNYAIGLHGWGSMRQAHNLLVGKTVKGAKDIPMVKQMLDSKGIKATDKAGTDFLRELVYKHDLLPATSYGIDPVTSKAVGTGMPPQGLPGFSPVKSPFRGGLIAKWFGFGKDATRNPFDVAGSYRPRWGKGVKSKFKLPGAEEVLETRFGPVAAGVEINMWVEGMNRIAPMIEGMKKGMADDAAASMIKRAQVDYSSRKFSAFEREYLQRIFPFFKFRSGQFKFLPGHLAERPGGPITQVMRGSRLARGDEYMPEHVSETAAVQVPGGTAMSPDDPETMRYLTGLGFMFEDPMQFAFDPTKAQGWKTAGLELLSSMRPELKGPLEFASGQSFFQRGLEGGRPMKEIGSPLGQIAANLGGVPLEDRPFDRGGPSVAEQMLMNSPLSRYLTTARQMTSPYPRALQGKYSDAAKTAFNLLTGLRFTDVTRPQQRGIMRQRAEAAIRALPSRSGRDFLQTYVPKKDIAELATGGRIREAAQAESLNLLLRRLRAEARDRSKEKSERLLGGGEQVRRQQAEIDAIIEMLRRQAPVTKLYGR